MRVLNKLIKFLAYIGIKLWVSIQLYVIAFILTTPVIAIGSCIFDKISFVPDILKGNYFIAWLLISIIPWIFLNIYTSIQAKKIK